MINPSDILQLCRLCLVEDAVNHSIFEESGELRSIFLKISSCLPVSIHKDDGLPEKICDTCSTKLDSFYQFWNETVTAEKQLLEWLSKNTKSKPNQQTDTSKKMETTEVKQEEIEATDPIDMSSDAKTYILQQQQLPYSSVPTDTVNTSESDEPTSKRPRRASAVRALEQMESEDEDDPDMTHDNYAKTESDDSDKEEEDEEDSNHQENPSTTSMEEQPGPSGIVKKRVVMDDTPVVPAQIVKPCHVVLNEIKGLLNEDGFYIVPGRSRRALTCYRCFKKFYSAEALEVHKAEHEPESGDEDAFPRSDSEIEIEIESDSDEEEKVQVVETAVNKISKSPNNKKVEQKIEIEYVPKPPEHPQQKQVQVVEPIIGKPKVNVANVSTPDQSNQSKKQSTDAKKVPVLCNIQIRCLSCDILFTNSELLMLHTATNVDKPCCFTCKVCSESYSMPADYLDHIMQHNTFSSSRYGYRAQRRKPEFRCTYCQKEFEHRFMLKQHEDTEHKHLTNAIVTPEFVSVREIKPTPIANSITKIPEETSPKPNVEVVDPIEPTAETAKPKIWVIQEALMKSPEPPVSNEPKPDVITTGVKRKIDDMEVLRELIKPGKRGRPTKTPTFSTETAVEAVGQVSSLTCDECFDVFQTKAAFDEHMVFHEANKAVVVPAKAGKLDDLEVHVCQPCNINFKSAAGLRRHNTCAHEKLTSFVCSKCSKIFSSRRGLNIHKSSCAGTSS